MVGILMFSRAAIHLVTGLFMFKTVNIQSNKYNVHDRNVVGELVVKRSSGDSVPCAHIFQAVHIQQRSDKIQAEMLTS